MPVQDKDLGKYKRNGIFINEINQSIITIPIQDVLINLVPGFSRKGPVNRPVYIENDTDFINIFGDIDRQLEKKGSFFHRTCLKMLESGPIWALNLLSTLDSRDRVNWESISVGSFYDNDIVRTMPYSKLFNRQDFWYRDDESFLDYVNIDGEVTDQLLHLTNLGDKTLTTFIFKSPITGFDVSMEDWYGGSSKVPAYLHSKDWVSDYMVTVLVVQGDWTNYDTLSIDSTYSTYFTTNGLLKSKVTDFANLATVTVLANWDVSLIPYFRDLNNRVMYIKSIINNSTDKVGLFAAYNEDYLLSSDYPTGKMDVIGDGIVGEDKDEIDFMSYQETISENLEYMQKKLDSASNVFGNYSTILTDKYPTGKNREATWTNGYIHDATITSTASTFTQVTTNTTTTRIAINSSYTSVSGCTELAVNDAIFFNKDLAPISANTAYYIVGTILTNTNLTAVTFEISESLGGAPLIGLQTPGEYELYLQRVGVTLGSLTNAYFVLDGNKYTFDTGSTKVTFDPLEIANPNTSGKIYNRYDVLYLSKGNLATVNILKGTQSDTASATKPDFTLSLTENIILGYVHLYYHSALTTFTLSNNYEPVTLLKAGSSAYRPYSSIVCTGATVASVNYLDITFVGSSGGTDYTNYNQLRYRAAYDEISTKVSEGNAVLVEYTTGDKLLIPTVTSYDYATQSDAKLRIRLDSENPYNYYMNVLNNPTNSGYGFLIYYADDEFVINDNLETNRLFTSEHDITLLTTAGVTGKAAGVIGKQSALYEDYYNGVINNWDYIYVDNITGATADRIYLKMWFEGEELFIDLMDEDKVSPSPYLDNWLSVYFSGMTVHSLESSYKQTVEIESFDTTKYPTLVTEISVDKSRFSELVKGGFLEAYYNTADYEIGGDLYGQDPRKLTRILSVRLDSTNSDWKVIKCDAPIMIAAYTTSAGTSTDYQTTYYPQIDIYVDTYKGIKLDPFTIHTDSIPNGTETRQSSILDIMAKTTNLGKGLINKNKISWRYLIDSFGLGLTDASKQQYADIGGEKLNCFGFINMPSARSLKKSTNPYFINDDGTLSTALLKAGGDETKSPSFLYTFATGVGRSTVGYFFPYVTIDDEGIPKEVPPAMFVATTYMNKHNTSQGGVYPWTIAAGITDGRITGIADTEMDFTNDDLENLAGMGANPIVKKGTAGFCIESEYTAQVFPYSSLSLIHSREVLIELENRMYDMLLGYQWRFNTPEIQSEIKFRADKICQTLKNSNALYDYKNIMDKTNNTNFIVDLSMGVIDTYIEIIKGMGIIVNNITILKKGDIESGGFI